MTRRVLSALLLTATLVAAVGVVSVDARQDLTTQLALFLRDLRNGTLGATQAISSLKMGTVTLSNGAADRADLASGDSLYLVSGSIGVGITPPASGIQAAGNITTGSGNAFVWASRSLLVSGSDGQLMVRNNASTSTITLDNGAAGNGQSLNLVQTLTELTTIAAAATTDTTIQMPATSVVLGVSVRTTVTIPTAATYTVGDSGSAARFSTAAVSASANSTDPGNKAGAYYNASALSVRITPNATPASNAGRVRVTIYYYTITPPTS